MFKAILVGLWYSLIVSPYAMFLYVVKGRPLNAVDVFIRSPYFLIPFVFVGMAYGWIISAISLVVFSVLYVVAMWQIVMKDVSKISASSMVERSQPYMAYVESMMADGKRINMFKLTKLRIES